MPIPFMITVDAEEEWPWDGTWPTEELPVTNVQQLPGFQDVCARFGAAVTYFVNYAVLADPRARLVVRDLAARPGVEIGLHVHPWNTPPIVHRGPVRARETFLHNLPEELVRAKLETILGQFDACGLRATSFRGGRYSTGPAVQRFLAERGFTADVSICPFTTWSDDGAPDYRRRGPEPVRVAPAGDDRPAMWEIPLSLAFTRRPFRFWQRVYETVGHSWLGRLRLIGAAERLGLVRKVWLNFEYQDGRSMLLLARKARRMGLRCLCFTVHSSSLAVGGNCYTPTEEHRLRLLESVALVLGTLARSDGFEPATASQTAARLEREYLASPGNQPAR